MRDTEIDRETENGVRDERQRGRDIVGEAETDRKKEIQKIEIETETET